MDWRCEEADEELSSLYIFLFYLISCIFHISPIAPIHLKQANKIQLYSGSVITLIHLLLLLCIRREFFYEKELKRIDNLSKKYKRRKKRNGAKGEIIH